MLLYDACCTAKTDTQAVATAIYSTTQNSTTHTAYSLGVVALELNEFMKEFITSIDKTVESRNLQFHF
jgi:hypothetical protein